MCNALSLFFPEFLVGISSKGLGGIGEVARIEEKVSINMLITNDTGGKQLVVLDRVNQVNSSPRKLILTIKWE